MIPPGLAAGLCMARLEPPGPGVVALVRPVLQAALENSHRLPPLGMLADLVHLAGVSQQGLEHLEIPGLDLRRYDDRVIGPWLTHRLRSSLADAMAGLPVVWHGPALAVLAETLIDDLEPGGPWWTPGGVRGLLQRTDEEIWRMALADLQSPEGRDALRARVATLVNAPHRPLIPADVYLVQHLPYMPTRADRVAVRQILEASDRFAEGLPRRVRSRRRDGSRLTPLAQEDRYPTGGFSALTNVGSPENLVASELVYMDDDAEIDLFDVRFAEGELLYYTRDESTHTRRQRIVHLIGGPDLEGLRVKDPDLPWQRVVLWMGLLHAVVERVIEWIGSRDLCIRIHLSPDTLAAEGRTLELAFRGWIEAGTVWLDVAPADRILAGIAEEARSAEVDLVWFGAGAMPPDSPESPKIVQLEQMPWPVWAEVAADLAAYLA